MMLEYFKSEVLPLKNKLYRFANSIVGDDDLAKDIVQETMLKTWEKRAELKPVDVLKILKDGNDRFCAGRGLNRNVHNYAHAEKIGHQPLAVVLSGVDERDLFVPGI